MRVRRLALPVAAVLGASAAAAPGLAAGSSPPGSASFQAYDYGWTADGNARSTQVTIAQGGTVTFSYPSGRSEHNADFGRGPHPTSCAQSAGPVSGRVPPLPHVATGAGWSGSCTFSTPGTYTFHCDLHTFMTGTIVVEGPAGSPLAGRPSIHSLQRGTAVRGLVQISPAGAGGRLEVDVLASPRSLGARTARLTRVGRIIRTGLRSGTVRFSVPLDAVAKRALRRRGHLTLTVRVVVRSPRGTTASASRRIRVLS